MSLVLLILILFGPYHLALGGIFSDNFQFIEKKFCYIPLKPFGRNLDFINIKRNCRCGLKLMFGVQDK